MKKEEIPTALEYRKILHEKFLAEREEREKEEEYKKREEERQAKIMTDLLIEDLTKQIMSQKTRPYVQIHDRRCNIELIFGHLKEFFEKKGYHCQYDCRPTIAKSRGWSDGEGWTGYDMVEDESNPPYFILGF